MTNSSIFRSEGGRRYPLRRGRHTIVINGDPICADSDFPALLAEFKEFCQRSAHNLFFSASRTIIWKNTKSGLRLCQIGEEARFHLADYEISGKKGAKMRMNINHAKKGRCDHFRVPPLKQRDPDIESAFEPRDK